MTSVERAPKDITSVQQMVSSCAGAVMTSVLVTPLDVVKTRLQSQVKAPENTSCRIYYNGLMDHICPVHGNGNSNLVQSARALFYRISHKNFSTVDCTCPPDISTIKSSAAASQMHSHHKTPHLNGTLDAFVKITRYEGIRSLWSGLPPTMVMAVPATVFYFTTYDQLKYRFGYRENDPSTKYVPLAAGSCARTGAATLITPLELIRTKMQSEKLSYRQVGIALRHSVQEGGWLSLMRGLVPTLLRDIPFSALYWFGYEYCKVLFMKRSNSKEATFVQTFAAGAISGSIASVVTVPFDVIKTHRQMELGENLFKKKQMTASTWYTIQKLYTERGVRSLFSGLVPRVIKVAPACAIMISSYEFGKHFFRAHNEQHQITHDDCR